MHALNSRSNSSAPAVLPAERAHRPATSYVSLLINSLGAGCLSINRKYRVTDANEQALSWLNKTREEVVGRPFSQIAPRSPMRMLKSVVEEGIFVDRHMPSYQRPGQLLDLHIYPTNDGAILFFRDLTEQELVQREAAFSKTLLQSALDALTAHVVIIDGLGTVIASNTAWQQFVAVHGLHAPDAGQMNYLTLYNKRLARRRDAQRIGDTLASLLNGNVRSARLIHTWPLAEGVCWFQLNAARFEWGEEPFVVIANEDVSAVKEAERASGEMAERLLSLQEEERRRIAEELHDSTAQHLVSIGLNIMKLRSRLPDEGPYAELFEEIQASVQESSKELRTFSYLLHPPRLEEDGLQAAATQFVHGFGCRTGLRIVARITDKGDFAPFELQRCIFRIIQEGLANVFRHASATEVRLELRHLRQQLHLILRDNGVGMIEAERRHQSTSDSASMGVGIRGIKARLRQFGGELVLRSTAEGTRLHAVVPFIDGSARNRNRPGQVSRPHRHAAMAQWR